MQDVVNAWEDAYFVLEKYTQFGQIDTVYALETIAQRLRDAQEEQDRLSRLEEESADLADDVADAVGGIGDAAYGASNGINQMTANLYDAAAAAKSAAKEIDKIWDRGSEYSGVGSHRGYTLPNKTRNGAKNQTSGSSSKTSGKTAFAYVKHSHSGEDYVTKETTPLDDLIGLKPNETLRVLKVGEAVLSPEENASRLQVTPDMLNTDISEKSSKMSNSHNYSNDSSVAISVGDIVINGNADKATIEALKQERDSIIQGVFKRIQGHTIQSGYRNAKKFTL